MAAKGRKSEPLSAGSTALDRIAPGADGVSTYRMEDSGEMSQPGHNAIDEKLLSLVQRIERLEEERAALGEDIKDVYQEVKSAGYDKKIVRKLIAERKRDKADVEEEETLLETYRRALGGYADTPLGTAAMERAG